VLIAAAVTVGLKLKKTTLLAEVTFAQAVLEPTTL
jgi:hypothetical protein